MRLSVVVLCCAMVVFVLGGLMVGVWCAGLCLMADSMAAAVWALLRETAAQPGERPQAGATLHSVLDWARRAS